MAPQQIKFSLDVAKIITALGLIASCIYWAGKIDQKVSDVKEDVVEIKKLIFQPAAERLSHK